MGGRKVKATHRRREGRRRDRWAPMRPGDEFLCALGTAVLKAVSDLAAQGKGETAPGQRRIRDPGNGVEGETWTSNCSSVNKLSCVVTGFWWELGWMWELWQVRRAELTRKDSSSLGPGALQRAACVHVAASDQMPCCCSSALQHAAELAAPAEAATESKNWEWINE